MIYSKNIAIKNQISEISKISELVEKLGEKFDLPMKTVFDINLSLDEIITNTISYGYDDVEEHYIKIDIAANDTEVVLTVIDDGKKFNPLDKGEPDLDRDLEDIEIGGLGIMFVKEKMDEIKYLREDEKNILILKKRIKE
eukprot:Anaeramoba_ignava/a90905_3.p1 GENE.a90905_3~~a90905_3.p1  ORF type:complete len:140 (-),score=31.01 a90905_3:209-628(-)